MSSKEEWCRQQLANLQIADRRLDTLAEIRNHLVVQPSASNCLSLHEIFSCIEEGGGPSTSAAQQTTLACDILSICMSNLAIDGTENRQYLLKCLQHPSADVRLLGLHEVERQCATAATAGVGLDDNVTFALIECLRYDSEKVAAASVRLLTQILPGVPLANPAVREKLTRAAAHSELVKCRVYEVAVGVAVQSATALGDMQFLLNDLVAQLDTDDLLFQMNVLAFLADLAQSAHGLVYLENGGVFEHIARFVKTMDASLMRGILASGYMRFFGAIATTQPRRVIEGYPQIVTALFQCFAESECGILPVALDTLGHLCRLDEGVLLLNGRHQSEMRRTMVALRGCVNGLPSAMQVRVLNCLEEMFRLNAETVNPAVSEITQTWYKALCGEDPPTFAFLHEFCRKPFPDIKLAAVSLVSALCAHTWGVQAMAHTAGFVEYLLDRHIDFDKDVKQVKFTLIKLLAASGTSFGGTIGAQLEQYVAQGAFYVSGVMEVAVEGS